MAANDLVRPLAETPERPIEERTATFGAGDDFARVLQRAGVAGPEAQSVRALIGRAVPLTGLTIGAHACRSRGKPSGVSDSQPEELLASVPDAWPVWLSASSSTTHASAASNAATRTIRKPVVNGRYSLRR